MRARAIARRVYQPDRPAWDWLVWLTTALLIAAIVAACRTGAPVIDRGPQPEDVHGTISGTVRGVQSSVIIEGRSVEVVNLETNERQRATTNVAGGFTFKVRPGKYRVELALRPGERVVKEPDILQVDRSDIDADADFLVSSGSGGVSDRTRPRPPVLRLDPQLGSPTA